MYVCNLHRTLGKCQEGQKRPRGPMIYWSLVTVLPKQIQVYVTESDACHINRAQLVTRPAFSYVHNTKAKQRSCQSKREPCARQWYAQVTANSSFDKKKRIDSRSWCKAIISDTSSTHQNPKTDSTRSPKRPSPNLSEKWDSGQTCRKIKPYTAFVASRKICCEMEQWYWCHSLARGQRERIAPLYDSALSNVFRPSHL